MKALIVDCYVDEPGNLGVPPFFGIYPRYLAGAAISAGAEVDYYTVDDWRGEGIPLEGYDSAAIVGGTAVPGKYLATMPASSHETSRILASLFTKNIPVVMLGPCGPPSPGDPVARFHDLLKDGESTERDMEMDEWNKWANIGATIAATPINKRPTIVEIETYRGCIRYNSGGCSFCIEPSKGKPRFRSPKDISMEVEALRDVGAEHFRLGGQTCIFSYMAEGLGKTDKPEPNPDALEELLKGVKKAAPYLNVLHVDNGNPAVIAKHPKRSKKIAEHLVEYCTSGNVVALGLESADPAVAKANNLNTTPDETFAAIKMINEVGGEQGETGLPELLPGINLLAGLEGETKDTYDLNTTFLEGVLNSDLLLRRINIRQVSWQSGKATKFDRARFLKFKETVRDTIDNPMLKRLVPEGTVLKEVYLEIADGNIMFGRQMGSYPLLVGIPYKMDLEQWVDVAITDHGKRSVTGVEYPLDINKAPMKAMESLPGIGRKRASRIFHERPIRVNEQIFAALEDKDVADRVLPFLSF